MRFRPSPEFISTPERLRTRPPEFLIGHRGASAYEDENTMKAFERAFNEGANMCELDIRATKNGELVVSHGADLEGFGKIKNLTLGQVKQFRTEHGEEIPTLKEVLQRFVVDEGKRLYIELKDDDIERPLIQLLEEFDTGSPVEIKKRIIVGSFKTKHLRRIKELSPDLQTAWLLAFPSPSEWIVNKAKRLGVTYVHPWHPRFWPMGETLVKSAHEKGIKVISGHTEDLGRIKELSKLEVDGICSNKPDLFKEAFLVEDNQKSES